MGNYASVVLGDKPIRYYRLSETSGTTALDQLNSASNGTLNGGVTLNQTGLLTADTDPCMLFNGSTGYISLPTTGLPTGAHAWTVEAWVQLTSTSAGSLVFFWGTASGTQAVLLWADAVHFYCTAWVGTSVNWAAAPVIGRIYAMVGTYDGTNLRLYVNGQLVAGPTAVAFNLGSTDARIGSDGAGDFFPGYIDEVAIYNSALSATQISNHYSAGIGALNFPVVPLTAATRDGHMTATTRDGLSLSTKTRGNPG